MNVKTYRCDKIDLARGGGYIITVTLKLRKQGKEGWLYCTFSPRIFLWWVSTWKTHDLRLPLTVEADFCMPYILIV